MKKRIFSLLLMVVLLVTAIPVMAVSAVEPAAENDTAYYTYFVGAENGPAATNATLIGNFTAFANEDNSTGAVYETAKNSGSNQKWYNKVDGGAAISMYNSGTWQCAENAIANGGGLSQRLTRDNVNNSGDRVRRMELNNSWFTNNDDLFIETSSVYYGYTGNTTGVSDTLETFRFGVLRGMVWPLTCEHSSMRLISTWRAQQSAWNDSYARNNNLSEVCGGAANFKAAGLTLYMQKTTTTEGENTYISYAINYNNGLKKNMAQCSDTGVSYAGYVQGDPTTERIEKTAHDELYTAINNAVPSGDHRTTRDSRITLYQRTAFDVYTIRVYAGALTQAEKEYNHLIDLLGFYQVAIPEELSIGSLMSIAPAYMATNFVYDETAFAANKTALAASLADAALFQMSDTVDATVFEGDDGEQYAGIRFQATVDASMLENYEVTSFGILIAPKAYVVNAGGVFTAEALEAYVEGEGYDASRAYLKVEPDNFYSETAEGAVIAGGFASFSAATFANNPEFVAVAFLEADGEMIYSGTVSVDVKATLTAYRDILADVNAEDEAVDICDAVLAQFASEEE